MNAEQAVQNQLQQVFADNFASYYRAHAAHVNVTGRNFYSDHQLLGEAYEYLQAQIDVIGELIRSTGSMMSPNLDLVLDRTQITDSDIGEQALDLLQAVRDDIYLLHDTWTTVFKTAEEYLADGVANAAQDQIQALEKLLWKFDTTLG